MNIQFNHDSLKTINVIDLMNFVSYIFSHDSLKDAERVYVNTSFIGSINELNCRVTIKLQYWRKGEKGEGNVRYWIYKRANDFSCINGAAWQSFPPMPMEK